MCFEIGKFTFTANTLLNVHTLKMHEYSKQRSKTWSKYINISTQQYFRSTNVKHPKVSTMPGTYVHLHRLFKYLIYPQKQKVTHTLPEYDCILYVHPPVFPVLYMKTRYESIEGWKGEEIQPNMRKLET